jgi:hypothetical protein
MPQEKTFQFGCLEPRTRHLYIINDGQCWNVASLHCASCAILTVTLSRKLFEAVSPIGATARILKLRPK